MASTDPLDKLLCILNETISEVDKASKLEYLKASCEDVILRVVQKISEPKVFLCEFSNLQFPRGERQRCMNYYPVRTTGDGNCLYNACSIALCGSETLSTYLRCLTSIELFLNSSFYVEHPIIEQQHNKGAFSCTANAFSMCLSDIALDSFTNEDPSKAIVVEAYNNAINRQWSSFICLLALSTVVNLPIESYFPYATGEINSEEKQVTQRDSLATMFNCTILPRQATGFSASAERIHIFRCALMPTDYCRTGKVPPSKNHYVCLSKPQDSSTILPASVQQFVMEHVSPAFKNLSTEVKQVPYITPVVSNYPSTSSTFQQTSSTLSSSPSEKLPKKQTVLYNHFPKKRKLDKQIQPEQDKMLTCEMKKCSLAPEETIVPPDISSSQYDIGNFVNVHSLTDEKKYEVLCNIWVPPSTYTFPVGKDGRKFRLQWLNLFPWLAYSQKMDGAFCINCVLFGSECKGVHNTSKLQRLFRTPLNTWKVAPAKCREHCEKSPLHKAATARAAILRSHIEQRSAPIQVMLDEMKKQQIEENRKLLRPVVEAIVLCGRQNIPLRGHRDDSSNYLFDEVNCGNFIEILKYGASCAGKTLDEVFKSTPKNLTYKSKTIQNQIIDICGDLLTKKITDEILEAKFFSVLADEAADISKIEQLSIVLRFVDKCHQIREEFLGFVPLKEGLTGEAIARTIEEFLHQHNLPIENLRGQGYDGAGNMAGRLSGVATKILEVNNKALYVHCNSHILNLCVATSCKEQLVSNMMEHVRIVSEFFNFSPKRFDLLVKTIEEMCPKASHKRLINVCKRRWVARIDGLSGFIEVFPATVKCLETIRDNSDKAWNVESTRKASYLYLGTIEFSFIVSLVVVSRCLEVTRPLTVQLQEPIIDAGAAREKVSGLYVHLEKMRNEVDARHASWFEEAKAMAESVGISPSRPRAPGRAMHRANTPADSPTEYYKRVVSITFLDHLKIQVQTRFSETNLMLMDVAYGLPKNVMMYPDWKTKFLQFLKMYEDDLPQPRFLNTELEMWSERCQAEKGPLPSKLSDVLPFVDKHSFPNIYTAFQIFATIPVTTCTCERSISVLRRLKTYLRSTMSESRLKGLVLLNVHREILLDTDEIIDHFAMKQPRRMMLKLF